MRSSPPFVPPAGHFPRRPSAADAPRRRVSEGACSAGPPRGGGAGVGGCGGQRRRSGGARGWRRNPSSDPPARVSGWGRGPSDGGSDDDGGGVCSPTPPPFCPSGISPAVSSRRTLRAGGGGGGAAVRASAPAVLGPGVDGQREAEAAWCGVGQGQETSGLPRRCGSDRNKALMEQIARLDADCNAMNHCLPGKHRLFGAAAGTLGPGGSCDSCPRVILWPGARTRAHSGRHRARHWSLSLVSSHPLVLPQCMRCMCSKGLPDKEALALGNLLHYLGGFARAKGPRQGRLSSRLRRARASAAAFAWALNCAWRLTTSFGVWGLKLFSPNQSKKLVRFHSVENAVSLQLALSHTNLALAISNYLGVYLLWSNTYLEIRVAFLSRLLSVDLTYLALCVGRCPCRTPPLRT